MTATPNGTDRWTLTSKVHFGRTTKGRKLLRDGEAPPLLVAGSVPRIARLVALAHRFEALLASGEVANCADLARLAGVSRPRVTQIMNLLLLAPDIQETLLDLPRTVHGRDPVTERDLRAIAAEPSWGRQRRMWREVRGHVGAGRSA